MGTVSQTTVTTMMAITPCTANRRSAPCVPMTSTVSGTNTHDARIHQLRPLQNRKGPLERARALEGVGRAPQCLHGEPREDPRHQDPEQPPVGRSLAHCSRASYSITTAPTTSAYHLRRRNVVPSEVRQSICIPISRRSSA